MVTAVVNLKRKHNLVAKDDPVDWLNSQGSDWKADFPLPVDDDVGNAILADMVRTAVSSEFDTDVAVFEGKRFLSGVSTGQPRLNFQLVAQPFYTLNSLFTESLTQSIHHRLHIELFNTIGKTWHFADAYRIHWKNQPALKFNNQTIQLQGEDAIEAIRLRFRHVAESIQEMDIGADGLDCEVPWVFVERGDLWQFVGQASQKLSEDVAIIWVPNNLTPKYESDDPLTSIGDFLNGQFLRIDQDLVISAGENHYKFSVNQQEETPVEYRLVGQRLSFLSKPTEVFIGRPDLLVVNRISGRRNRVQANRIRTRKIVSDSRWHPLTETPLGVHELQIVDGNDIMFRKRIGLLPVGTKIHHIPGASPKEGSICLDCMGDWQAACLSQGVKSGIEESNGELQLNLSVSGLPPAELTIEFWQDQGGSPIRVNLPYPSSGAVFVDPDGVLSPTSADLFLDSLYGYRIRLFFRRPGKSQISIRLALVDFELTDTKDLYFEFNRILGEGSADIPLMDFLPDMRGLLAVSTNLDAHVKFSLFNEGTELVSLKIRRFMVTMEPDFAIGKVQLQSSSLGHIGFDKLKNLRLETMRMSQPEQTPIPLESITSQGMEMGIWRFSPETRTPGPWLIYSAKNSEVLVRPLLWNVLGQTSPEYAKSIHAAVFIADEGERSAVFQRLFFEMAKESSHSGWDYLRALWNNYKHLPLTTFQVWRESISNTSLLAAMVIYLEQENLARLEEEMPVMWELVPVQVWEEVLRSYRETLMVAIDEATIIQKLIGDAIDRIANLNDVMGTVAKVIRQCIFDETDPGLKFMQEPTSRTITVQFVAKAHKVLLQRQSEAKWPSFLKREVEQAWSELPSPLKELIPGEQLYRATVVHFPFTLVYRLFKDSGDVGDPLHVFKYRQLKQFDEDWYNYAFSYACGYWSQKDRGN